MVPYVFLGLAVALGFRAGLFNIGAEGQFYLGAIFGVLAGNYLIGVPGILHIPLALAFGMLGGFIWAAVPGLHVEQTGPILRLLVVTNLDAAFDVHADRAAAARPPRASSTWACVNVALSKRARCASTLLMSACTSFAPVRLASAS